MTYARFHFRTPDGVFTAVFSPDGLLAVRFPPPRPATSKASPEPPGPAPNPKLRGWFNLAAKAINAALAGRALPKLPPLDLAQGTEFHQAVWRALTEIPTGETRTYKQIAARLGRPKAARAVGQACGANPIPLLIPCHRVVAAGGRLGGFSAGLAWKELLLEREARSPRPGHFPIRCSRTNWSSAP
jgi:O-6-methylguanine DNA methyltransferase